MRYFNWKLALFLTFACVVVVVAAVGLRRWQQTDRAAKALERGLKAYESGNYTEAAVNLGSYISVQRNNVSILMKYADAQIKRRPQAMEQAMAAYRAVLRIDAGHAEAAQQLAEFYVAANAAREAELICKRYLARYANADIQRIYARALARLGEHEAALVQLQALLGQDPNGVKTYALLGQLAQNHEGKYGASASHWYDLAVEQNPQSAYARIMRARFHQSQGQNSQAVQDLQAAQGMDLGEFDVRLRLAEGMMRAGLLEDAGRQLAVCKKLNAADLQLWQLWAEYALKSQSKETMSEVAQNGLTSLKHDVQDFWPSAAELFIAAEHFEKAKACVASMRNTKMTPRLAALAAYWDGCIANSEGQDHAAIAQWQRAIELGYGEPRVRLPLAAKYAEFGDMQSALDQLVAITLEHPESLKAQLALIRHYQQMLDHRNARRQAQTALKLFPDNALVQLLELETRVNARAEQKGEVRWEDFADVVKQLQAYETNDQYAAYARQLYFDLALMCQENDRAGTALKAGPQQSTEGFGADFNRARLCLSQEDTENAVALLEHMIKTYPDESEPVRLLASTFIKAGDTARAIHTLEAAYAGRTGTPRKESGLWLSETYQQEGQYEKAKSLLSTLQGEFSGDLEVRMNMLSLLLRRQDFAGAQTVVADLKDIEGEKGKQWRYAQARVWLADNETGRHHGELVDLLQRTLKTYPKDKTARLLLASVYEQAEDWQLAIACYGEILQRTPDDLTVVVSMVEALQQAGEPAEADRVLARAAERKLTHPALTRLKLAGDLKQRRYGPVTKAVENAFGRDPNSLKTGLLLVKLKLKQRQFAEAEQLLGQLEELDPDSPALASAYMALYEGQGRLDDMLSRSNQRVASQANAASYLMRAEAKALAGQAEEAIEDYAQAEHLDPNRVDLYVSRGKFYQRIGRHEQAITDLNRAQALSPQDMLIRGLAIESLFSSPRPGRQQEAKQALEQALKEAPHDSGLLFLQARLLVREGTRPSIDTAEQALSEIVAKHPAEERAWQLWAQLLLERGQSGKALDAILRGLAERPDSKALLLLKAAVERQRSSVLAIQTLRGLSELYPQDTEVALRLASLYAESKDHSRAIEVLERQRQTRPPPEKVTCALTLALILYDDGQAQKAQALLKELDQVPENAAEVFRARTHIWVRHQMWAELKAGIKSWQDRSPDDNGTLMELANALVKVSDREATAIAEALLRESIAHSPAWAEPKLVLGNLLFKTDRIEEAGLQYRDTLQVDPNNLIALNNWAWFLCEKRQDYPQALSLANRGLKIAPAYVDLLDTRGTIFYRMGQFDQADEDFRRSIQLCPLNVATAVGSRFRLGRVYVSMGRRGQAVQYLEESLKLHTQMVRSRGTAGLSAAEYVEAEELLSELKKET